MDVELGVELDVLGVIIFVDKP